MTHSARKHAKLAPSSAYRWLNCPGSIRLSAGLHEAPSVFAAEGTAAHMLAEACLSQDLQAEFYRDAIVDVNGGILFEGESNGATRFTVDLEMIDAVQLYLDVVREIKADSDEFEIEQRMDMTALVDDVFGTGDVIAYVFRHKVTGKRRITVVDLKYGKGVAVEVEENEQELTYAAGVCQRYHNRGVDEVELVIVQPRAPHRDGPVRRWVTDIVGLYEHVLRLQAGAAAVNDDDAPLIPGPWCKFCKAAAICPALDGRIREIIMSDPEKKSFQDWKVEAADIAMVKGWATRREEFAHSEALQGRMPPGAKLVGKKAFRKWNDTEAAVAALKLIGLKDDELFTMDLVSPAQAERALPKSQKKIIADLATAKSSGTVLAPLDDPRPSMDPNDARGFEAVDIAER